MWVSHVLNNNILIRKRLSDWQPFVKFIRLLHCQTFFVLYGSYVCEWIWIMVNFWGIQDRIIGEFLSIIGSPYRYIRNYILAIEMSKHVALWFILIIWCSFYTESNHFVWYLIPKVYLDILICFGKSFSFENISI